jgi:hypothetical protein
MPIFDKLLYSLGLQGDNLNRGCSSFSDKPLQFAFMLQDIMV